MERDVRDVVTPLWRLDYDTQLQQKISSVCSRLTEYLREARGISPRFTWPNAVGDLPCPFLGIVPAPNPFDYRNKCEFTIGLNNDELTVGFNAGRFVDGDVSVKGPDTCVNIPAVGKHLASSFTTFIRSLSLTAYNKNDHSGFWRLLTVRVASSTGQAMIIVQVQTQFVSAAELESAKAAVIAWFEALGALPEGHTATSLCWQEYNGVSNAAPTDLLIAPLRGPSPPVIVEKMLGLDFFISPSSFFQTNSRGAERLYSVVKSFCTLSDNDIVLDICCGTGMPESTFDKYLCVSVSVCLYLCMFVCMSFTLSVCMCVLCLHIYMIFLIYQFDNKNLILLYKQLSSTIS